MAAVRGAGGGADTVYDLGHDADFGTAAVELDEVPGEVFRWSEGAPSLGTGGLPESQRWCGNRRQRRDAMSLWPANRVAGPGSRRLGCRHGRQGYGVQRQLKPGRDAATGHVFDQSMGSQG